MHKKDACMQEKGNACMKIDECMHNFQQAGDHCMPKNGVHAYMHGE